MQLNDFDYDLPSSQIAQVPLPNRGDSRLLIMDDTHQPWADGLFAALPGLLRPGDCLVFNDTKVIPARLFGAKDSGGRIELMLERLLDTTHAVAQVRASKPPRPGGLLHFGEAGSLLVTGRREDGFYDVACTDAGGLPALLERAGQMPLPPYIERAADAADTARYQTVYARQLGAVAAPTAGLHFDAPMLARLDAMGVARAFVTLHVGAGTFQPVRVQELSAHQMHAEAVSVPAATVDALQQTRARGGRVVAVGTTSVRALESAAQAHGGVLAPFMGDTRLFITPGYRFHAVDALLTNFHMPCSTLLMLVCAFAGYERVMAAYRHAVAAGYRFFSYGDAMWIDPGSAPGEARAG